MALQLLRVVDDGGRDFRLDRVHARGEGAIMLDNLHSNQKTGGGEDDGCDCDCDDVHKILVERFVPLTFSGDEST